MNKTAIKNFAIWARNKLIEDITYQMRLIGIDKDGIKDKLPQSTRDVEFYDIGTRDPYQVTGAAVKQRSALVDYLRSKAKDADFATAYENVIEEVAYTWFNRLIAIRFMEVNDYLPGGLRVLSSASANKIEPELVTTPFDSDLTFTDAEREQIFTWQEGNKTDDLFRLLFIKECNALNEFLPELFEKTTDYTELLLNLSVTNPDGVVSHLVHDIPEEDFNVEAGGQVEIIGWLYQYYNTEPKAKVFARPSGQKIKKEEIPAATQLFTPDWIVRYMVQNSLGRMWVEGHEADPKKLNWQYYLPEAEQEPEVAEKLAQIREEYKSKNIEDIKFLDPCMGSGHILVYAFEVFMQLYLEQGYDEREAAECILTNNLYGLDIDRRAFQLAYFALFMKAREYNRRILSKGIELNICAIEESNGLKDAIEAAQTSKPSPLGKGDRKAVDEVNGLNLTKLLLTLFEDAKEYGSILNIPAEDYGEVREYVQDLDEGSNLFVSAAVGELKRRVPALVKQAEIMSRKYEVVVTNPPYMGGGMSTKLSDFVKKNYKDSKSDLFAVFIEKCADYTQKNGYQAMLTQHAWMFLSSYVKLREKIQKKTIINMAHLGPRAFEEIGGEVVQTTSWVMLNDNVADYKGTYARLIEPTNQQGKADLFLSSDSRFITMQENFTKIPGSPVAYWISNRMVEVFEKKSCLIADRVNSEGKNVTTNNEKFILFFWEVRNNIIGAFTYKWLPCSMGGMYRRWYGNVVNVIDWSEEARKFYKKNPAGRIIRKEFWDKIGITWGKISSSKSSFRLLKKDYMYQETAILLDDLEENTLLLAILNSHVTDKILEALNPTMNYQLKDIISIPIPQIDEANNVIRVSNCCIDLSKSDWDSFETSWDFKRHPLIPLLLRGGAEGDGVVSKKNATSPYHPALTGTPPQEGNGVTVAACYATYKSEVNARFDQLKANEEELNRIFIDIYGLQDELTPEVADKDVTVARIYDTKEEIPDSIKGNTYVLTKTDVVKSLLSYAVGCMFGRYSLDVDGLAYAGGEWDESKYTTFYPDADNIIPITDEAYSEDDIVDFFVAWVKKAYGVDTLEENLAFIADSLGTKGTGSRDRIRAYFLKDFYKDHLKTYKKRPIYWLYDSGKQNGFKALIYMHRYNADTTGKVRADYLHRIERIYESEINRMTEDIEHSDNAREIGKATKRREKLQKQLKECQAYDEQLASPALERIAIDLDDGVKVNYDKIQTVKGKKYNMLAKI